MTVNGTETATITTAIAMIVGIMIAATIEMVAITITALAVGMTVIATGVVTEIIAGAAEMTVGIAGVTTATPGMAAGITVRRLQTIMVSQVIPRGTVLGGEAIVYRTIIATGTKAWTIAPITCVRRHVAVAMSAMTEATSCLSASLPVSS